MADESIDGVVSCLQEAFSRPDGLRTVLEAVIQAAMNAEVREHLGGAGPHERSVDRRGHRNGSKPRTLKTRVGELALSVPRLD